MNLEQLLKIKEAFISLKEINKEKTKIINNYEEAWNDIEKLQLRINELGKIEQTTEGTGTPYDPFKTWKPGTEVLEGQWWMTEGGYLWEAIKDGVPTSETDSEYWDIVTL